MNQEDRARLKEILDQYMNERLIQIIFSNPSDKETLSKVKVRPLLMRGHLVFQAEEFVGNQAFHKNLEPEEAVTYACSLLDGPMRQMELSSGIGSAHALVSKKGSLTVKSRKTQATKIQAETPVLTLTHNRQKKYVLEEGRPVPFLADLGVMTQDGKVVRAKYDKFRQINRFLEFIEDVLPKLDKTRETTIIDFGCGKSYLTFAMYYYLKELKGYPVRIIGLDLKKDVIAHCNQLSEKFGFENLRFYHGDIATYEGVTHVDMVVTLHACDTATDYALAKAVQWGANVILSVPCCQHELNRQIHNDLLEPVLQYGLIKERMAALYTDALRAEILENQGYRTQILEFIDMEHTPKNLLIRGVKQGKKKDNIRDIKKILEFLDVKPTLAGLLLNSEE